MTLIWISLALALLAIFLLKRCRDLRHALSKAREERHQLELECTRLKAVDVTEQLSHAFKTLSAEALGKNNQLFLDLAKTRLEQFQERAQSDLGKRQEAIDQLIKPVKESLGKFEGKLSELERARIEGTTALKTQMQTLASMHSQLQRETSKLAGALKATAIRGRWGEVQLRRVVELSGMVAHCDFYEQQTTTTEEGRRRPDLIVRLPAGRTIIIDAKAPLDAYLEATATDDDETRSTHLRRHADQIRQHIRLLASKGYADHFESAAEFVVLFLPGEIFFSAALSQDPTLIEVGAEQGVILATPTTLISLLRAVSYGWKQEAISQNAQKISDLGAELYKRLTVLAKHWSNVGKQLGGAVKAYNEAVGSFDRRVVVTAKEFERLGVTQQTALSPPSPIDQIPREL